MNRLFALTVVSVFVLFAGSVRADTITGNVSAQIILPLTIIEEVPMKFGKIMTPVAGGTVTLASASNTITTTLSHVAGTQQRGFFTVEGEAGMPITISFPSSTTVTDANSNTMTVDNFTHAAGPTPAIGWGGEISFRVGARLTVDNDQPPGIYTGTYTITVAY